VVSTVEWIVRKTMKLCGYDIDETQPVLSAHEEIRGAIELHHTEGAVVKRDRDMLGGILDLRDLTVDDVMVHRKNMLMADIDLPNEEIIDQILKSPYTRVPLWQGNQENIVGILHAKDLLRALRSGQTEGGPINARELMQEPWFVPETTTLLEQLNAFRQHRKHFALVVDEYGALMGLVTLEDILEEIVGEISDEHDVGASGIRPGPRGSMFVDGDVAIRDLNRILDWNLPEDEAVTIAGLVIHEAQTIPEPGQMFSYYGYRFEIVRKQRNQLTVLRIWSPHRKKEARSEEKASAISP
jgi:Mg2+/Co2+ transporter CorB